MRFAVALGLHSDEPSQQMMLSKALSSSQRRKELHTLWYSIHITDLWLTNAVGFTIVNGPVSAAPVEVRRIPSTQRNLLSYPHARCPNRHLAHVIHGKRLQYSRPISELPFMLCYPINGTHLFTAQNACIQ